MLAGAKAKAGIEHHDALTFPRFAFAPARFESKAQLPISIGFEMPFPRFRPVLAPDFGNSDFAGTDFQTAILNPFQSDRNFFADFCNRPLFAKDGDGAQAGFYMEIGGNGTLQNRAKRFHNGIFGFARRGDGNPPE